MTRAGGARRSRPGPDSDGRESADPAEAAERAEIRPMRPEDLTEVAQIERRAFSVPWKEETFRRLLGNERARAWTAVVGEGTVVGYAVMWFTDDGAQLGNLAVAEDRRRRGLGRRLVRRAMETVRGSDGPGYLVLEVRESNEPAIRLYRGLGFRLLGRRKSYYRSPPEDALVMGVDAR